MRVAAFLQDQCVAFETLPHPPAFSAQRRAHYLHVPGRQLVKCVLLKGPTGSLLAVLPATHQVDLNILSRVLEGPVRLASADEIADVFLDCERGVTVPFGSHYGLKTILEASLDPETLIVFEAHLHGMAIRMRCRDFETLEKPRRLPFARFFECCDDTLREAKKTDRHSNC